MSDSAVNVSAMLEGVTMIKEVNKEEENEDGGEEKLKSKPLFTYADQMPIDTLLSAA